MSYIASLWYSYQRKYISLLIIIGAIALSVQCSPDGLGRYTTNIEGVVSFQGSLDPKDWFHTRQANQPCGIFACCARSANQMPNYDRLCRFYETLHSEIGYYEPYWCPDMPYCVVRASRTTDEKTWAGKFDSLNCPSPQRILIVILQRLSTLIAISSSLVSHGKFFWLSCVFNCTVFEEIYLFNPLW
jgi:hypothetical protein